MNSLPVIVCVFMPFTEFDQMIMLRALAIAEGGKGGVSPNPLAGCVIVNASRHIIGEGAHLVFGGPHAEPNAIQDAESRGRPVAGATAYITLEPHAHQGKTPPCSKLLIQKKISRCVIAMQDPNPRVMGAGIRELRAAGIDVEVGLLEAEAQDQNRFFIKHTATGTPFITLKLASSLDGRSALANGESKWITSEASRARVHALRSEHDAVLIGTRTALTDNPSLTVRLVKGYQPWRLVLDARMELPPFLNLFTDESHPKTIIVTSREAVSQHGNPFPGDVELLPLDADSSDRINLSQLFHKLGERGMTSILIEAGPTLAQSILREQLFDELILFYAPILLGGDARPSIGPLHLPSLAGIPRLRLKHLERVEHSEDVMLRFRP